jgi:broad specificity phosphatase PhoE
VAQRVAGLLQDVKERWDGKKVVLIGHRATSYSLEHLLNGRPLEELVSEPFEWRPGWRYVLD